jgi:hypothetical protein
MQWIAPKADSACLLRALQFYLALYTQFTLLAVYQLPGNGGVPCTEPPPAAQVTCNIDPDMNQTQAAQFQAQCDAYKEQLNRLHVEYEACVANAYFINLGFFRMTFRDFVVQILSAFVTAALLGCLAFSFKKKKIRDKRSIAEKLRIVQFWKIKEFFGLFFVMIWISGCVYYLFMYAVNNNHWDNFSKNFLGSIQQYINPLVPCFIIYYLVKNGARFPLGRFILVLSPDLMDLKHMVFESPDDLVAARRERNKRKDMLRKEVSRLRKSVDRTAADRLREETIERVASKGSKASQGSRTNVESEKK